LGRLGIRSFELSRGNISVSVTSETLGDDICVTVSGGDRPHIGAVTLSIARPSLKRNGRIGVSTSILTVTGHKDDIAAKLVSETLARALNKNVVAVCGIHCDDIAKDGIDTVMDLVQDAAARLCDELEGSTD
jgi:hypothetical protein